MRNTLFDFTPRIPATACHQNNDVEAYSRYRDTTRKQAGADRALSLPNWKVGFHVCVSSEGSKHWCIATKTVAHGAAQVRRGCGGVEQRNQHARRCRPRCSSLQLPHGTLLPELPPVNLSTNFASRARHGVDVGIGLAAADGLEHVGEVVRVELLGREANHVGRRKIAL